MKNGKYLGVILLLFLNSCHSGLYTLGEIDLNAKVNKGEYDLSDFDIYVYNICEDTEIDSKSDRFCDCPEKFYEQQATSSLKKVEEVYMLISTKSDLVIYLTTFSHKYIKQKEGFLNAKEHYYNQVVLDQVEYIYIGRQNEIAGWIHFPKEKKGKDMIVHYIKDKFPDEIYLTEANIATAENHYTIDEKFPIDSIFKNPIVYKKKPNYKLVFYKNNHSIGKEDVKKKIVEKINIILEDKEVYFVFSNQKKNFYYKITEKRIRFRPNFFLIDK
tara:strand:+ start:2971 stop:3786 length:816 start_codon:yes stop_codon:yes gene_type:complete